MEMMKKTFSGTKDYVYKKAENVKSLVVTGTKCHDDKVEELSATNDTTKTQCNEVHGCRRRKKQ